MSDRPDRAAAAPPWSYAAALALAAAGLAITYVLLGALGGERYVFVLAAVALAAVLGGTAPGLVAAAASTAGFAWLFLEPRGSLRVASRSDLLALAGYLASASVIAVAVGAFRAADRRTRRALAETRAAQERLRLMTEGVHAHAILLLDPNGLVTGWNAAAERLTGWPEAEILGRSFALFHTPEEREAGRPEQLLWRATRDARAEEEGLRVRKDGTRFYASVVLSAVRDEQGHLGGFAHVLRDVSDRRRADELDRFMIEAGAALAESMHPERMLEQLARLAVPALADACTIETLDEEGRLRLVALAHADPRREHALRDLRLRFPPDPATSPVWQVLRSGQPERASEGDSAALAALAPDPEHREALRSEGLRAWLVVPLATGRRNLGVLTLAITSPDRELGPRELGVARDLARRAAQAIHNAGLYVEMQRAGRERDEVLAILSHDLRAPLGAVFASARALRSDAPEGPGGERIRRGAAAIERAAEAMSRLVADLLDLASLEAGRLVVNRRPEHTAALVHAAADAQREAAGRAGVTLVAEAAGTLPDVDADRERVLQVLGNLLADALDGTEGGLVTVRARAVDGGRAVAFEIEDSGRMIPEDQLAHFFDRFRRGRGASARGAGLGLAVARGIVEAHGGRIWAESRSGQGSRFTFTLPAAAPWQAHSPAEALATRAPG
ncbi:MULTISPECIES: ATP-binding protein [unclassified Anaeromyxobacter]|uniref:sensor histidine kinase n=1 Tax=unclassified Anaeromyxobacter TaxID=2620896 RepID=UPI001F5A5164|nr:MULTISPECIES: ATP-binding protein [unclassified Anaeromyxobacter]